jgi:hypothetical protein
MTRLAAIAVKRGWESAVTTLPSDLSPRNSRFVAASLLEGARFELLLPIRKAVPFGDRELSRRRQKAFRNGDHRMWDREFESGSLQRRVRCEPDFPTGRGRGIVRLMALPGLWENWRSPAGEWMRSFAIITTTPNELCRQLHNRMPVILRPESWPMWLGTAPRRTFEGASTEPRSRNRNG